MLQHLGKRDAVYITENRVTLQSLFLPILLESLLKNLLNTVNVLILSNLSDKAVAAVGVASQLITMVLMLYTVTGVGASVVISQNLGAGNRKAAADTSAVAVVLVAVLSIFLGIIFVFFAPQLLTLMQLQEDLMPDGLVYLRVVGGLFIFEAVQSVLSAVMRSHGYAKHAMAAVIMANILNAFGCYLVVYQPIKIPLMGVLGVACARVMSAIITLIISIMMMVRMNIWPDFRCLIPIPTKLVGNVLRVALPHSVSSFSYNFSQTVSTAIISSLGAVAVSSKIYVSNIVVYVYIATSALGSAVSILVGRLVGAGKSDDAYRLCMKYLKVGILCSVTFSFIAILLRYPLIGLFTRDKEIMELAAFIMTLDIFVEIGRGINLVVGNSLTASADVKFPAVVSICSAWGCSILLSYVLGVRMGLGLAGCWIAFAVDELFRGIILIIRWKSRQWQRNNLVIDNV